VRAYIIRRAILIIPTLILASMITFLTVRLIPGDIIDMIVAQTGKAYSGVSIDSVRHQLGLDVPIYTQYGRWLGIVPGDEGSFDGVLQGNLGDSMWKHTPVVDEIIARWPVTIELGLLAIIIGLAIALPIGTYSAARQDTVGDYLARSFAILCISVPGFWLATLAIVFPARWWGYMPPITYIPLSQNPLGNLQMLIMPSIVLGMLLSGTTMRMLRATMLEVLRQDYVRTAWAKGLRERVVIMRHTMKNAMIPVVTIVGLQLPILIGGSVIIEQIFQLPGLGALMYRAVFMRDYTMIMALMLLFAVGLVLCNLLVDLVYAFLDPRIHLK
jgi:peptide/nickel transport system permease protein